MEDGFSATLALVLMGAWQAVSTDFVGLLAVLCLAGLIVAILLFSRGETEVAPAPPETPHKEPPEPMGLEGLDLYLAKERAAEEQRRLQEEEVARIERAATLKSAANWHAAQERVALAVSRVNLSLEASGMRLEKHLDQGHDQIGLAYALRESRHGGRCCDKRVRIYTTEEGLSVAAPWGDPFDIDIDDATVDSIADVIADVVRGIIEE